MLKTRNYSPLLITVNTLRKSVGTENIRKIIGICRMFGKAGDFMKYIAFVFFYTLNILMQLLQNVSVNQI